MMMANVVKSLNL